MALFNKETVRNVFQQFITLLNFPIDSNLQSEYQSGLHPSLLSYEKVEKPSLQIPALQKIFISVQTFLNQPCQFYDIFRACRHVILVQILFNAVRILLCARIPNLSERIERLKTEIDYDKFESIVFELIGAAKYVQNGNFSCIEFIPEVPDKKNPDIKGILRSKEVFIEFKKLDRMSDFYCKVRNKVRELVQPIIDIFEEKKQSSVIEIVFKIDPTEFSGNILSGFDISNFLESRFFESSSFTISFSDLSPRKLDLFKLFPSPEYYFERYSFTVRDHWMGLVNRMLAKHTNHFSKISSPGMSSWLDEVDWECAVKWRIENEDVLWKFKKMAYRTIFKGLEQLKANSDFSILHCWIERDYSIGHKKSELLDFFKRLQENKRDVFSWLIFNETLFDSSPKGNFDLIEHAHLITGQTAIQNIPFVTNIFLESEYTDPAEFGIGHELPSIDENG